MKKIIIISLIFLIVFFVEVCWFDKHRACHEECVLSFRANLIAIKFSNQEVEQMNPVERCNQFCKKLKKYEM